MRFFPAIGSVCYTIHSESEYVRSRVVPVRSEVHADHRVFPRRRLRHALLDRCPLHRRRRLDHGIRGEHFGE